MNIKEAFNFTKQQLIKAGVEDPAFDAIYLFEHVFSMTRTDITVRANEAVDDNKFELLKKYIARRALGEPIQYITGKWYFMDNTYKVGEGVLIPRDDTEVLVNSCKQLLHDDSTIIDLCSGSGIIAVTLKKMFEKSTVYAVEKSDIAYSFLQHNCKHNNAEIKTIHADLYDCVNDFDDSFFDLVVSNPPYIITDEIPTLQKEVQFEPTLALDGGKDGFDFYRGIISKWSKKLKHGGHIAFEIGEGQFSYISSLLKNAGFCDIQGHLDLSSTVRAITAQYKP